jgi:beta-barrel assembly-enhancing protease
MNYEGILLDSSLEHGRTACTIEILFDKVNIRHKTGTIEWKLKDVTIAPGGTGKNNVFITHSQQKDISVYTSNKSILKDPALAQIFGSVGGVNKTKRHFRTQWSLLAIVAAIVVLPFVLFFSFRKPIVKKIASKIPSKYESAAGEQLFKLTSQNYKFIKDSVLQNQLSMVTEPLIKAVDDTTIKFNFFIINDTTVNAFALPGGKVVVHSGLILKADNWEEIEGVLAHEIAHVTQRHHIRGILSRMGVFYVLSLTLGDYSGIIAEIGNYGSSLESLMYSREFEFEADNKGFEYLQKANINPQGMITFFEKLQKQYEKKSSSPYLALLNTHPATADRIKNLKSKKITEKENDFYHFQINLSTFKEELQKNLKSK